MSGKVNERTIGRCDSQPGYSRSVIAASEWDLTEQTVDAMGRGSGGEWHLNDEVTESIIGRCEVEGECDGGVHRFG